MRCHLLFSLFGIALILGCASPSLAALAEPIRCPTGDTVVAPLDSSDAELACSGVSDAKTFLEAHGLKVGEPIEIRVVERLPGSLTGQAFACFRRLLGKVDILTFSACRGSEEHKELFGLPFDRGLYRSVVAHEIAHAVASRNFVMEQPAWVADEYIAYVTQLATMPSELRERILNRIPEKAFVTYGEIHPYVLMMSPDVFAVKAYRHFARPENGDTFLWGLLSGEILLYREIGASPDE